MGFAFESGRSCGRRQLHHFVVHWKGLGTPAVFIKTDLNVEKCPFLAQDAFSPLLLKSLPLRVCNGQRSVCPGAGTAGAAGREQPAGHRQSALPPLAHPARVFLSCLTMQLYKTHSNQQNKICLWRLSCPSRDSDLRGRGDAARNLRTILCLLQLC